MNQPMGSVCVNERGMRIGQDHHKAVLTDVEVEALIMDRGSDEAPLMSYSELARKWGISKSSVRDYLVGRRRGQAKKVIPGRETSRTKQAKVRVDLRVSLRARAVLHRLGGGRWIERVCVLIENELRRAPLADADTVTKRVLAKFGGVR